MGIRRMVGVALAVLAVGVVLSACVPPPPPPPPPPPATDYSDGVIKMSSNASLLDYFQPAEWRTDNANDADLGSTNPVLLPGNLVFAVGKQQQAFLLNADSLGQQGGELARMPLCFAIGGNATDGAGNVYVSCSGGVKKVAVNTNANPPTMTVAWTASVPATGPVTLDSAGLVWSVDRANGKLYGLNPNTGMPTVTDTLALDGSQHFPTPVVSGSTVLVESGNHVGAFSATASGPALWTSATLDGIVQSRPAVVGPTVVVATEHDTLYGLKLSDGTPAWTQATSVGTPVPLSRLQQLGVGCGNIDPLGITSNLAVNGNTVFAVAERLTNNNPEHVLLGVDAATGNVNVGPTNINPPGMNVPAQQQRAGLLAANGNIYVGFGGLDGDCGNYHGWVVAARQSDGGVVGSFEVATASPSNYAGAVWAPGGLAVDASGNVYAATGNSFNWPG